MFFVVYENQIARRCGLDACDAFQLNGSVSKHARLHKLGDLFDGSRPDQSHGTFLYVCRGKGKLGLEYSHGAEDLLGQLHCVRAGGGFGFAALVGVGGNHSDCLRELVDRVSERLVLTLARAFLLA
jgi:hypothetical protein